MPGAERLIWVASRPGEFPDSRDPYRRCRSAGGARPPCYGRAFLRASRAGRSASAFGSEEVRVDFAAVRPSLRCQNRNAIRKDGSYAIHPLASLSRADRRGTRPRGPRRGDAGVPGVREGALRRSVLASAEVLQQSNATTTVTLANGELVVQDGPFADTKEQLGGTFVIDVPDLDAAIEWAQAGTIGVVGSRRDPTDRDPLRRRLVAGRTAGQVTDHEARAVAERAARESYGRLVALLAASTRDVALAEDALTDAFERALRTWPTTGVPDNPQGWLVTVARNRIRDLLASAAVRDRGAIGRPPRGRAHRARPGRAPRQAAGAAVRVCSPGDRPRGTHSADAPSRARLRRGSHRPRVRGAAPRDGTAPGPGKAPHPRRRYPVPGADARGAACSAARRA